MTRKSFDWDESDGRLARLGEEVDLLACRLEIEVGIEFVGLFIS
jgi:hypothetical protein